jgi:hypothetical protein
MKGMTVNEAAHIIMCEIYYLNYKDRMIMRKALQLLGSEKKQKIITKIQFMKRENYLLELRESEQKYDKKMISSLFTS